MLKALLTGELEPLVRRRGVPCAFPKLESPAYASRVFPIWNHLSSSCEPPCSVAENQGSSSSSALAGGLPWQFAFCFLSSSLVFLVGGVFAAAW